MQLFSLHSFEENSQTELHRTNDVANRQCPTGAEINPVFLPGFSFVILIIEKMGIKYWPYIPVAGTGRTYRTHVRPWYTYRVGGPLGCLCRHSGFFGNKIIDSDPVIFNKSWGISESFIAEH